MKDTDKKKQYNAKIKSVLKFSGSGVLSKRAYFSTYHLWAAEHFSRLAGKIEDKHEGRSTFNIEHRAYVVNSIFSSVAFMEAAINEFFQDAHDNHGSYIKGLDEQFLAKVAAIWEVTEQKRKRTLPILEKYEIALNFAEKEKFDKSANLYKDVNLAITLRNYLTHYKPKNLSENNKHPLDDELINKFEPNKLMEVSGNNFYPDHALGAGCTKWCLESVKNFSDKFFEKMEIEPNYQKVDIDKLAGKT